MARIKNSERVPKPVVNIKTAYYLEYRLDKPNPKINVKIYRDIVVGFVKYIVGKILEGRVMRIPGRLGIMYVMGRKPNMRVVQNEDGTSSIKGLSINWPATNKYWAENPEAESEKKYIYFFNEHTNGYRYRLKWRKKNMIVVNKFSYYFKLSRANNRMIATQLKNNVDFLTFNTHKRDV